LTKSSSKKTFLAEMESFDKRLFVEVNPKCRCMVFGMVFYSKIIK